MEQKEIEELRDEYLAHITLPNEKPAKPFCIAVMGLIGSGKTTVGKMIQERVLGSVLVQSDSMRYLFYKRGVPWGDNIKDLLAAIVIYVLEQGYGVIMAQGMMEAEARTRLREIVQPFGISPQYIMMRVDDGVARLRKEKEYTDETWHESTFEHFRVASLEKIMKNFDTRAPEYHALYQENIEGLIAEIDNNGSFEDLEPQVDEVVKKLFP